MEHAFICPQCNAPLKPHRFARTVVCDYCGTTVQLDEASVSAAKFHDAYRNWNSPFSTQDSAWITIGESNWVLEKHIAVGDISDIYSTNRARWPTELAILKVLRDLKDARQFANEWKSIQALHQSNAPGADTFTTLLPQPIIHGIVTGGQFDGRHASLFRRISGFHHTFEDVSRVYPQGISPRASIWLWRRILEVLSFIHASGMVHGAVLPSNLLIQENEHGVRLVGYSCAGRPGDKLRKISSRFVSFYPRLTQSSSKLSIQADLAMSARCIITLLGGNLANANLPAHVPGELKAILQRVAQIAASGKNPEDAWKIREELGEISDNIFGSPEFIPIVMPS